MGSCPQLWMRLSGALQKKRSSELSYREIVRNSSNDDTTAAKQVRPGGTAARGDRRLPGVTRAPLWVSPWQGWPGRAR